MAQTIPDAKALVVTTPQEISLADVRKSINFCRQVKMDILGIVENMSGFLCPHCGKEIDSAPLPSRQTKACPYCAETIRRDAQKCRHCGEPLP